MHRCHMLKGHCHQSSCHSPSSCLWVTRISVDIGPDSVRVILKVHAPTGTRPHTKHSLSDFSLRLEWANCVLMNSLPDRIVVEISSLRLRTLSLHFRCSLDQTRVHIDSGKVPCVQLSAYHVVHVPLHLIHTMVILHLRTSCPCGCTSLCSQLLPLSCTWKREHTMRCLPSCPANLRDVHRLGNGGAQGQGLLLQIRIAVQNSQHSYRPIPISGP
jgi:hypothetical protein